MDISNGPYLKGGTVPFVNIQGMMITGRTSNKDLWVQLDISNEKDNFFKDKVTFSNFVYITEDIEYLSKLCYDRGALIKRIKKTKVGRHGYSHPRLKKTLTLQKKEYTIKARTLTTGGNATPIWHHSYVERFRVKYRPTLYVLVASYRIYKNKIEVNNVVKDTILLNGRVPPTANLYRLTETMSGFGPAGSVWPGAVHEMGDNVMAGLTHTIAKHPEVEPFSVLSIKNVDARVLQASMRLKIDMKPSFSAPRPSTYISEPTLSRNGEGLIHGFFSFDLYKYSHNETELGRAFKSGESLQASSRVKDIIIYSKLAGAGIKGNSLTPGNQGEGHCGTGKVDKYKRVASLGNNLDVISTNNDGKILNVAFMDRSAVNYSEGHMQYKVEVLLVDDTREALVSIIRNLSSALSKFEGLPPKILPRLPWPLLIDQYIAALIFMYGDEEIEGYDIEYWKKNLLSLTSKFNQDTSINGYGLFLQSVRIFIAKLMRLTSPKYSSKTNSAAAKSRLGSSKRGPFLRIEKEFKEKFEIQGNRNVGLNYLEASLSNVYGVMPVISYEDMASRVQGEEEKFSVSNPKGSAVNSYGFLTPAAVNLESSGKGVSTTGIQASTDSLTPLLRNKSVNTTKVPALQKSVSAESNKISVLNVAGISAAPFKSNLKKLVSRKGLARAKETDSRYFLSQGSAFTVGNTSATAASGSTQSIIKKSFTVANSALVNTIVNKQVAGFKKKIAVTNASNIEGSLALMKVSEDKEINTEINSVSNIINFGSLVRVEFLDGFVERFGVRSPIWSPLTVKRHEAAEEEEEALVCRLVTLTNTINVGQGLGVKPLSTLFIIGGLGQSYMEQSNYKEQLVKNNTVVRGLVPMNPIMRTSVALYARNSPLYPMPPELPPPPPKKPSRFSRKSKPQKKLLSVAVVPTKKGTTKKPVKTQSIKTVKKAGKAAAKQSIKTAKKAAKTARKQSTKKTSYKQSTKKKSSKKPKMKGKY